MYIVRSYNMLCLILRVIFVVSLVNYTCGYNILGFFPYKGKSHFASFLPLMKALAVKGHNVTVLSHFPQKHPFANFTDVDFSSGDILVHAIHLEEVVGSFWLRQHLTPLLLAHLGYESCTQDLSNPNFLNFMKSAPRFDVIITEFFNTRCFLSALRHLQGPLIGISSCIPLPWNDFTVGVPNNPAYIPNHFMPFSDKMNFLERTENTFAYLFGKGAFQIYMQISSRLLDNTYFSQDSAELNEIATNVSVMLVNNHFSLTLSRPLPPNYIEVGGISLSTPKRPSLHIDKWINESKHGVIYFSLGSMIKGHTFPEEKKQMFINAFSRLPQRVLWKWENETMLGKTDNIMIEKWMPQFDILCHPNVKVFIAHGGMLGVTEAVHCGVPMIIMPQFGDQFTNAKAVEASGGGLILDYRYLDEESIYKALTTALDPKSYKNAKELSARFKDRPMPPLETAIYWIEYVARHGGAPHLRTAAVGMPLYQYLLLDVIAFLAFILFSFIFIVYYITRAVLRRFCGSKKSTKKVKKN